MKCIFCNREIVDDAIFCAYCGRKVVESIEIKKKGVHSDSTSKYYKVIVDYLMELVPDGVDIDRYLNPEKKDNMRDIFYQFCITLQDFQSRPNVIGFMREERKADFNKILFDYDYIKVRKTYTEESLYDTFCNSFPVKNKESKGNLWRYYARGIIDTCNFLYQFGDVDRFNDYFESFHGSYRATKKLQKEICGMGPAIAFNIIKDLGFTDYAKPDTHTKDVIGAMGFETDDESVVDAIRLIAEENDDTAFNVDRMIWLICSGNYFEDKIEIPRHKQDLIKLLTAI